MQLLCAGEHERLLCDSWLLLLPRLWRGKETADLGLANPYYSRPSATKTSSPHSMHHTVNKVRMGGWA